MPRLQPFTQLCMQMAQHRGEPQRADLHLHTTHSDGDWTPEEVVRRAAERGLGAIAITDHDNCSATAVARAFARSIERAPEIIAGAEITCKYRERELHLLAYFFDTDEPGLARALTNLRVDRRKRFLEMLARLPSLALSVAEEDVAARLASGHALGRRDLAVMLWKNGQVRTVAEAFLRYLHDNGPLAVPKHGLPIAEALSLVHSAGGVSSWAHPPQDVELSQVLELRDLGLDALEAIYPAYTSSRSQALKTMARTAGLAITGGSDCHGPHPVSRMIGNHGVRKSELEVLRARANTIMQKT